MTSHTSKTTTDHNEIRHWAEARQATPACVKGTGSKNDPGMIRLDFPGYSGDSLEPISWDEWFKAFDDNKLALVYQDTTADGAKSNFNKLIGRDTADERARGDSHASRHDESHSPSHSSSHSSSHSGSQSGSHGASHDASHGSAHHASGASRSSTAHRSRSTPKSSSKRSSKSSPSSSSHRGTTRGSSRGGSRSSSRH